MTLPRQPAAVVFDMDGLLFDTEALYQEAFALAAVEVGCAVAPDMFLQLVGTPSHITRRLLIEAHGQGFPVEAHGAAWRRHFKELASTRLALKPGAIDLLATLDALRLPRAIATSSSHQTVQHHLAAHDLGGRFDHIVAHGDYAAGKPAPDPFLTAAERLNVEPRLCLALEDSYNGVRSAASAGMMTIMVPDLLPATDEISSLCTRVVADLHEVRRLLAGTEAGAPAYGATADDPVRDTRGSDGRRG